MGKIFVGNFLLYDFYHAQPFDLLTVTSYGLFSILKCCQVTELLSKKRKHFCRFLQGACISEDCLLSHKVSLEKMPTCKYFLEGCCVRQSCPYLHVKISPNADICKSFLEGFCKEGKEVLITSPYNHFLARFFNIYFLVHETTPIPLPWIRKVREMFTAKMQVPAQREERTEREGSESGWD